MRFLRASDNTPIVTQADDDDLLAQLLQSDLQDDPEVTKELLTRLLASETHNTALSFSGNSCELSGDAKTACIENQESGRQQHYATAQVRQTVDEWLKFIEKPSP